MPNNKSIRAVEVVAEKVSFIQTKTPDQKIQLETEGETVKELAI